MTIAPQTPAGPPAGYSARPNALRTVLLAIGSIIIGLVLVMIGLNLFASANRTDASGTFTVTEPVRAVQIRTDASNVRLGYGDVAEPELRFEQAASTIDVTFTHAVENGTLILDVDYDGKRWWDWMDFGSDVSRLEVTLPAALAESRLPVTVDSGAGNVAVHGTFGSVDVATAAGGLELTGRAEDLTLETSAGNVRVDDYAVAGRLQASTSAGNLTIGLTSVPDSATVESSAGNVEFTVPDGDYRITADTSAGTVTQDAPSNPRSDRHFQLTTAAGNVTVTSTVP
jgi:hypothetical protein